MRTRRSSLALLTVFTFGCEVTDLHQSTLGDAEPHPDASARDASLDAGEMAIDASQVDSGETRPDGGDPIDAGTARPLRELRIDPSRGGAGTLIRLDTRSSSAAALAAPPPVEVAFGALRVPLRSLGDEVYLAVVPPMDGPSATMPLVLVDADGHDASGPAEFAYIGLEEMIASKEKLRNSAPGEVAVDTFMALGALATDQAGHAAALARTATITAEDRQRFEAISGAFMSLSGAFGDLSRLPMFEPETMMQLANESELPSAEVVDAGKRWLDVMLVNGGIDAQVQPGGSVTTFAHGLVMDLDVSEAIFLLVSEVSGLGSAVALLAAIPGATVGMAPALLAGAAAMNTFSSFTETCYLLASVMPTNVKLVGATNAAEGATVLTPPTLCPGRSVQGRGRTRFVATQSVLSAGLTAFSNQQLDINAIRIFVSARARGFPGTHAFVISVSAWVADLIVNFVRDAFGQWIDRLTNLPILSRIEVDLDVGVDTFANVFASVMSRIGLNALQSVVTSVRVDPSRHVSQVSSSNPSIAVRSADRAALRGVNDGQVSVDLSLVFFTEWEVIPRVGPTLPRLEYGVLAATRLDVVSPCCVAGATRCAAGTLYTCGPYGAGETSQACGLPGTCADATQCAAQVCDPTQPPSCAAGVLTTCESNGAQQSTQPCVGGVCRNSQSCWPACVPGTRTCSGGVERTCNAAGNGTNDLSCPSGQCAGNQCQAQSCVPNASRCSNGARFICNAAGTAETSSPCVGAVCRDSSSCWPTCVPGATTCSGGTLQTCSAAGNGYVTSNCPSGQCSGNQCQSGCGSDTQCPPNQHCAGFQCTPDICSQGTQYCSGPELRQCSSNGSSSSLLQTCGAGCANGSCCGTNACQASGQSSGAFCSGSEAVSCGTASGCIVETSRLNCAATGRTCSAGSCSCNHTCNAGATRCSGGTAQACLPDASGCRRWVNQPATELPNYVDDDCDGFIDEDFRRTLYRRQASNGFGYSHPSVDADHCFSFSPSPTNGGSCIGSQRAGWSYDRDYQDIQIYGLSTAQHSAVQTLNSSVIRLGAPGSILLARLADCYRGAGTEHRYVTTDSAAYASFSSDPAWNCTFAGFVKTGSLANGDPREITMRAHWHQAASDHMYDTGTSSGQVEGFQSLGPAWFAWSVP